MKDSWPYHDSALQGVDIPIPVMVGGAPVAAPRASFCTTSELLEELQRRGGTFAAVAAAQLISLKKSEDYDRGTQHSDGSSAQVRDAYFPFGNISYAHMIFTKAMRINSLVDAELNGRPVNFEGLRDTLLDIINYASFFVERLDREGRK